MQSVLTLNVINNERPVPFKPWGPTTDQDLLNGTGLLSIDAVLLEAEESGQRVDHFISGLSGEF